MRSITGSPHANGDATNTGEPTLDNGTRLLAKETSSGARTPSPNRSQLRKTSVDEVHDLICIGFGPASLAIAVALNDALSNSSALGFDLPRRAPKVAFLERQAQFSWHAGMLLPGTKMQISFIKDMATLRDPRSNFTFLNYLHKQGRLLQFSNLGTFLPLREEYEDYMRWCAGWFDEVVAYGQEVIDIGPVQTEGSSSLTDAFLVRSRDLRSGDVVCRKARNIVIAVGGQPNIPHYLPQAHPRVVHSSQYARAVADLLQDPEKTYRVAVVGNGQSAAEIFNDLHSRFSNVETVLLIRGSALRPSDDSPFVNEIFNPERVDDIFHQSECTREHSIRQDRSTNYGVVRLELLERIYNTLYVQRLRQPDENLWQHRILNFRELQSIEEDSSRHSETVRLHIKDSSGTYQKHGKRCNEIMDVDVVFMATGYHRDAHEDMLKQVEHLSAVKNASQSKWAVSRNYSLQLDHDKVSHDTGIWLQGCNESTHGLSDTLLSILATRAGEIVQSIFGSFN